MKQNELTELKRVPGAVMRADGSLLIGTYEGAIATTCYDTILKGHGLRARALRIKQEKAWQWWGVIDEHMAAGSGIIRLGYASQLFVWCLDRRTGALWCDHEITREPWAARISHDPLDPQVAAFGPATRPTCSVARRGWQQASMSGTLSSQDVSWALELEELVEPMTAICPVKRGRVNVTVKQAGSRARGEVRVGARTWTLSEHARGMLDYTHGMLARHTSWRWAIGAGTLADGSAVSFNVVAGFNQGLENVCWIAQKPYALGRVAVHCDPKAPHQTWLVEGEHIALQLSVEGVRQADKNLGVAASSYVQPVGTWTGEIAGHELGEVWGVAEDHKATW